MASNEKPTILFVHGSWHTPQHYQPQFDVLEKHGFPYSCPLHPSSGSLPPTGVVEDAQGIRDELTKLVETDGKEVIIIAHSYGGIVASQAVDAHFARRERAAKGKPGGVLALLFATAFVLPAGESLASAFGDPDKLPPFISVKESGMCMMLEPGRRFYNDLAEPEQQRLVSMLVECPATQQLNRITQAAYKFHPTTYLFCENDQALSLEVQKMMVQQAEDAGTPLKKETCSAGHSPFMSQPEVVMEVIEKIVAATTSI